MADITKCSGQVVIPEHGLIRHCHKRDTCYRFTATANEHRQSYFCIAPFIVVDGGGQTCDDYWPDNDRQ